MGVHQIVHQLSAPAGALVVGTNLAIVDRTNQVPLPASCSQSNQASDKRHGGGSPPLQADRGFSDIERGVVSRLAYEDRSIVLNLKVGPAFDPVRSDPRFADLLRCMNLQP
jgi:hypothetical protein